MTLTKDKLESMREVANGCDHIQPWFSEKTLNQSWLPGFQGHDCIFISKMSPTQVLEILDAIEKCKNALLEVKDNCSYCSDGVVTETLTKVFGDDAKGDRGCPQCNGIGSYKGGLNNFPCTKCNGTGNVTR